MVNMVNKETPTVREILILLGVGTFVAASVIMPGLPYVTKLFDMRLERFEKRRLKRTLKRLYEAELISTKEINGEVILTLTKKGKERILRYKIDELKLKEPKKWDQKWRLVIFDIPNSKKIAREIFRDKLKQLGFYRLQESVFIHPFECFDEIEFLRQNFDIKNDVEILQIAKLENEEFYRNKFGLE